MKWNKLQWRQPFYKSSVHAACRTGDVAFCRAPACAAAGCSSKPIDAVSDRIWRRIVLFIAVRVAEIRSGVWQPVDSAGIVWHHDHGGTVKASNYCITIIKQVDMVSQKLAFINGEMSGVMQKPAIAACSIKRDQKFLPISRRHKSHHVIINKKT